MKSNTLSTLLLLAFGLLLPGSPQALAQHAILAETIHTVSGGTLRDGVILLRDGVIQQVGPAANVSIPEGYTLHRAVVVTPGLIDGRSVVGLSGLLNVPADQQQLETSAPVQPELRAFDAYDADEELVAYLRSQGITTIHTGHAPGAVVSGQTMVAKTRPGNVETVTLIPAKMLAITLGGGISGEFKSPGTGAKTVAMLREELLKARHWLDKQEKADAPREGNLRMEALSRLLTGEYKALVHAHTAVDIQSAFRLADEFGLSLVLEGAAECYLFMDELKSRGAELILHPTMARAYGERKNLNLGTAALLAEEGIPFSLQSGYEAYVPKTRVVRYEAAMAAAYGLPFEEALRSITITPARILGLDARLGSIEVGKDADLVLYDGDPFEHLTRVCKVFIDGELVEDRCK
jgi:imidazolonepropionase-like amidohydrolase